MKVSRHPRRVDIRRPRRARPAPPALAWAEDVTGRCARVTALGGHSLLVENHTGILDFTDTMIRLDTRSGALEVSGDGLSLGDVRPGALIVRGRIAKVELPCAGGDGPDVP